jgi:pimeloyl-ACP methyl ester carboxylesterase
MQLYYSDDGPGRVVVLLHGFPHDHTIWDFQRTTLGSIYRLICPDLRGHGRSPAPSGVATIDAMADDVIELLDALKIQEQVVVGGLSMGGYIALSIAARYPERLRALMLIDTRAGADSPEAAQGREELARQVETSENVEPIVTTMLPKMLGAATRLNRPELVAQVGDLMGRTAPSGIAGALRGMAGRPDRTADLARISIPTLVMVGAEDQITPPEQARAMAEAIPNSQFVLIPAAGHLAPLENPAAANEAFLKFLDALP